MSRAGELIEVAVPFVWLGMVLAISLLETPLKFRAPGITLALGLGIGRLVFRALNAAEIGLLALLSAAGLAGSMPSAGWGLVAALGVLLAVQVLLVRPRLDRGTDFLFAERGRRPSAYRLRQGLADAASTAGLAGRDGTTLHVTPHQLRHTYGTALVNGGMSLQALMALLGHVSAEMTLRYASLASPTVRAAYDQAMSKARSRLTMPIAPVGQAIVPDRVQWLRAEMLKTRVAHGYCSRNLVAEACPYANVCEQCDNFTTGVEFVPALRSQLADVTALRQDAEDRGWNTEVARHARVITSLTRHLDRLAHSDSPSAAT